MVARIQGIPDEWKFSGAKTAAYRQDGKAIPPPEAAAVAAKKKACLEGSQSETDPASPDEQIALFTG